MVRLGDFYETFDEAKRRTPSGGPPFVMWFVARIGESGQAINKACSNCSGIAYWNVTLRVDERPLPPSGAMGRTDHVVKAP